MLLLLGDGGHADVVSDAVGQEIAARVVAPGEVPTSGSHIDESEALGYDTSSYEILNGIGFLGGVNIRRQVYQLFVEAGFRFRTVIDRSSMVRDGVELGNGAQVLVGAILNTGSRVGKNSIINSAAVVEHHVRIGAHSHVAPNATLCGEASIGDSVMIGAGAIVLPGVSLPAGTVVGAGAVVTRSWPTAEVLVGIPAHPVSKSGPR